jgi:glycosyltransferase involved in cell wall biosynthesis
MLDQITPVVLTYDEEPNLERTLSALSWARDILVVDSFSRDRTLELARAFPSVRVLQRRFDDFASQWNHALAHGAIETPWVLALDADYVMTPELRDELAGLRPSDDVSAYRAPFRYCIDGRPLRGSLYPASLVLFRLGRGRYEQDGHAYRLRVQEGRVEDLRHPLLHDDRKPRARWLNSQRRYAAEEADKLLRTPLRQLGWPDRVRTLPFAAVPLVALHTLFVKGVVRDGLPGLEYARQRVEAEALISLAVLRRRLKVSG